MNIRLLMALCATILAIQTSGVSAQLLLPTPELRVLQDCDDCPEMVILPDGTYISRAPIRVSEFETFVNETGYKNRGWGCKWHHPGFPQTPMHPAACITFQGAQRYVEWLSKKTGQRYRLPTIDELTYAVLGFEKTNYWWGQQIGRNRANCMGCGRSHDEIGTTPVDTYPANPFNLLDAVGNVWIWTTDCLTSACDQRMLTSGGWSSPPSDLRMTKRVSNEPNIPFNTYGIRVVREFE